MGPDDGPLVVLLHGFPEFWYSWRNQMEDLSEHFQVVAMDLRGYNMTDVNLRDAQPEAPAKASKVAETVSARRRP